jgi:single-stranded-DNA-specific exonuclease
VVVTDHHLPGETLPDAAVIVNPNQPGCEFPSKNLAGVGVMFYVLLALRAELRRRGVYTQATQPPLQTLLDLVALGTVADVVKLDTNNRILVAQGLKRMRAGRMHPGVAALFRAAGREASRANTFDLGFGLGPRLNAAGRLADMSLGIECLLTDDANRAWEIAQELDGMNRERRDIEAGMQQEALQILEQPLAGLDPAARHTISVFHETWHQGVIGIVASRLKEKFHRPTITFAPGDDEHIKGSGRSIPGFHLRDALDLVSKRHPGLLVKFGGHAMAAGLTVRAKDFDTFVNAFEAVGREWLTDDQLARVIETDGDIEEACFSPEFVTLLEGQVWGQGFPPPTFCGEFDVLRQTVLKGKHLKLQLGRGSQRFDAIWFNHADALDGVSAMVAYRLDNNTFNGMTRVQLVIEHAQ